MLVKKVILVLMVMDSSESYGTYFKNGATCKEIFGNFGFGSEPYTSIPK